MENVWRILEICCWDSGMATMRSSSSNGCSSSSNLKSGSSAVSGENGIPSWLTHSTSSHLFFLFLYSLLYEIFSIGIMKMISKFYQSVSSQDSQLFVHSLLQSLALISIISIFKSLKVYYSQRIALQSRYKLTQTIHQFYIGQHGVSYLIQQEYPEIDNPDQRITQDIDRFTQEIATFLMNAISIPCILLFYTIYLWLTLGYFAPLMCYLYFVLGSACSYFQARALIPLIYEQEKLEGNFRSRHVNYQSNIESITLLKGERDEEHRLNRTFSFLLRIGSEIMKQELFLNLIVNWFSYFGSIVNYAVVGTSVLYISKNANSTESDLASQLAAGSYACLYLISGLTTLLSTYESMSKICALSNRVVELIDLMSGTQPSNLSKQPPTHSSISRNAEVELVPPVDQLVSPLSDSIDSLPELSILRITNFTFFFPSTRRRCAINFELRRGRLIIFFPSLHVP
jgi:ATP-binding cassette, subfamily D (ALD), member 4